MIKIFLSLNLDDESCIHDMFDDQSRTDIWLLRVDLMCLSVMKIEIFFERDGNTSDENC